MMNTVTYFAIGLSMLLALLVIILVTDVVQLHQLKNARHTAVCSTPEPALQQEAQLPREAATPSTGMLRPNTTLDFNDSYALSGRTQLKLPDFYDSDPLLWFKVVEASFSRHDITESKERYGLVLHALKVKQLPQIEDVLSYR